MEDFKRARSTEQKEHRLSEIKQAAAELFATHPYHEITLTTIAERLAWSRANLYKYVTTKEEVFLLLCSDERTAYFDDLLAAFPAGSHQTPDDAAALWADVATHHRNWFRLHDLLFTIFETNVSVDCLVDFKRAYYERLPMLSSQLCSVLAIKPDRFETVMNAVNYHGVGLVTSCGAVPQVLEALKRLDIAYQPADFYTDMYDFISMCLRHWSL